MLQPGRFVAQHVAGRPFADRLHLVEQHVVGSVLQRQQFGDGAVSMPVLFPQLFDDGSPAAASCAIRLSISSAASRIGESAGNLAIHWVKSRESSIRSVSVIFVSSKWPAIDHKQMADYNRLGEIIATGRLIKPGRAVVLSNRPRSRSHLAAVLGQHLRPFGSMDGFLIV
jgi:hypothetical protein